jgi:HJR/Mrr/RecB family endonuclease
MTLADELSVRAILGKYENVLFNAIHGGWGDWQALQLGGRLLFPARSRACVVYDFIVQRAMAVLAGDNDVRVIQRDETVKFIFADKVALRFKKANDNGLGSNILTQATLGFVDQQQELPGLPDVHKVEVVYVLNRLQTRIEQVQVAARDGDTCLWTYDIAPDTSAKVIPLPTPNTGDSGHGVRIKIRAVDERKQNETGEK